MQSKLQSIINSISIKLYYQTELGVIYNADCFDILPQIYNSSNANSIDLICTDPPFLTTDLDFDKQDLDFNRLFTQLKYILKLNGWLFLFGTVEMCIYALQSGFRRKFEYILVKSNVIMQTYNTIKPFNKHELLFALIHKELNKPTTLTFNKEQLRTYGHSSYTRIARANQVLSEFVSANKLYGYKEDYVTENNGYREGTSVLEFVSKPCMPILDRTEHPTQKPTDILETVVKGYSNENDIVLDCFAGSGTTAIACEELNRNYIMIEKEEKYCNLIMNRIKEYKQQIKLF